MMSEEARVPLAVELLSRASVTLLVQTLAEDRSAEVTGLEAAPLARPPGAPRAERLRLRWKGAKGSGAGSFILKALPHPTWSQALNPAIPAPVEVLLLESDLAMAINSVIEEGGVAAGRAKGSRPAWILLEDPGELPERATKEQAEFILRKSAAFHALHWSAQQVLDEVYPWLPRLSTWIRSHATLLGALLEGRQVPDSPYSRWLLQRWPTLTEDAKTLRALLPATLATVLDELLADPSRLLDPLQASPQTLLNGKWYPSNMLVTDERLIVTEWARTQVGAAAWDLYSYLEAPDPGEAIERYLEQVATIIPELSEAERASFRKAYALCPLLALLLFPFQLEPDEQGALEERVAPLVARATTAIAHLS